MAIINSYKDADGDCHWPTCNVGSAKFYGVDWSAYLTNENDTISGSATWTVPSGLTESDTSIVSNVARIKLTATAAGQYVVKCSINTTEGADTQTHIQVMNLKVV